MWSGECAKTEIWTSYVMELGIHFPHGLRWPCFNATSCSSHPGLSGHTWVLMANSRQKLGVARGVVQKQRFGPQINNLHAPRAPLALTSDAPCSINTFQAYVGSRSKFPSKARCGGEVIKNGHSVTRTKDCTYIRA